MVVQRKAVPLAGIRGAARNDLRVRAGVRPCDYMLCFILKGERAMLRQCHMTLGILCVVVLGAGMASAANPYFVTDLGGAGSYTIAAAININGQVVGNSYNGDGTWTAYLYSNGTATAFGTISGADSTMATAINDSGLVIGSSGNGDPASAHAFLYDGSMHDLGVLPGGTYSGAGPSTAPGQSTAPPPSPMVPNIPSASTVAAR